MASQGQEVRIVEVGPRDGLQNISSKVSTETKIELIRRLRQTGLRSIEITSVVSPKAIPQLSDNQHILRNGFVQTLFDQQRNSSEPIRAPVLIPNTKGLQKAIAAGVQEVAVFVSASEGFSKANINCSVEEGLFRARKVAEEAKKHHIEVRGYVSCIFACPYDGPTPLASVLRCTRELLQMGCYEVSLGDTVGVGVASDVKILLEYLFAHGVRKEQLAGHFHDTYGQAVSNVWAAYQCGLRVFDSSIAGLGGCPFAPGAKGNVATEDLVYLFERAGIVTNVNIPLLVQTGDWISKELRRINESRAGAALFTKAQQENSKDRATRESKCRQLPWVLKEDKDGLLLHQAGPNLRITLNRPKNGNALTETMIHRLTSTFEHVANNSSISRIAICASGKFFCTGMDLSASSTPVAQADEGKSSNAQFDGLTTLFKAVDHAPQVTVAYLNGPAFGGGVGLALACDLRIASSTGAITLSEAKLGLCPATISPYVVREMGPAFSREAMLSGRTISAGELQARGVVAKVIENDAESAAALDEYLVSLGACAPRASTLCKTLVKINAQDSVADGRIRACFEEMMAPDAEAAFGLREFQTGRRTIDWDEYVHNRNKAKL